MRTQDGNGSYNFGKAFSNPHHSLISEGVDRERLRRGCSVKVKPSMVQPGRSPRLAVAGSTNEMSKDVLTAAYLQSGHLVSGGPNGCITVYDGVKKEWLRKYTNKPRHCMHESQHF